MRRVARLVLHLYPRPWRARYGKELEALLEDLPAWQSVFLNLLRGAMEMQLRNWSRSRIVTAAAIATGLIMLAVYSAFPRSYRSEATLALRDARGGDSRVVVTVVSRDQHAAVIANREVVSGIVDQKPRASDSTTIRGTHDRGFEGPESLGNGVNGHQLARRSDCVSVSRCCARNPVSPKPRLNGAGAIIGVWKMS